VKRKKLSKNLSKKLKAREAKYIKSTPGEGMGFGEKSSALSKYQGVTIKGKKYTRFSQFKTKPAGKKTTKEKLAGGIKLAIL